jgi:methylmalonyl-CoA mutase
MDFDSIMVETAGIGQSDTEIINFADICTYVMTPEYGAPSQLEKIAMFDYADYVVLNKSDKVGAKDAFRDVQKAYRNIHKKFDVHSKNLPIFLTNTRHLNNPEINKLFQNLFSYLKNEPAMNIWTNSIRMNHLSLLYRSNYLKYITETIRNYKKL